MSRSISARSKPLACSTSACSRRAPSSRRLRRLVQEAVRLLRPAPHPAAQLVQLREPEPVGVLDHHHGGVRHVDADLDHRRGDEHAEVARGEPAHALGPVGGLHLPVHEVDRDLPSAARRRGASASASAARASTAIGALDERAHDVRLAAGLHLLDDPAVAVVALATRPRTAVRTGGGRAAARRAPSRRGRRTASAPASAGSASPSCAARAASAPPPSASRWSTPNRCCSSIDGHQQAAELGVQQRVRADRDQRLAGRDRAAGGRRAPSSARRRSAGRARRRGPSSSRSAVSRCCTASTSVGAISAAWPPASSARSSTRQGDRGLAGADVALQQPLHRLRGAEVGADLVQRPLLGAGERERQPGARSAPPASPGGGSASAPAGGGDGGAVARAARPAAAAAPRTPAGRARRRGSSSVRGRWPATMASRRSGRPVAHAQRRRQRVADARRAGQRRAGQVAQRRATRSSTTRGRRARGRAPSPPRRARPRPASRRSRTSSPRSRARA